MATSTRGNLLKVNCTIQSTATLAQFKQTVRGRHTKSRLLLPSKQQQRSIRSGAASSTASGGERAATRAGADYFALDKRPIILYDGVCNL